MNKYLKYVRISDFFTRKGIEEKLNSLIIDDMEIIYYYESIRDIDQIQVVMICGKINKGNQKQIL